MSRCIFCGPDPETDFNPEHIIPQCIGGALILPDAVCERCNSRLGGDVDTTVWRIADVVDAHKSLGLKFDRQGVFHQHYSLHGADSGSPVPVLPEFSAEGLRAHTCTHDRTNGTRLYGANWREDLRTTLSRRPGFDRETCDELIDRIGEAEHDQIVDHPSQDLAFTKVQRQVQLKVQKRKHEAERLCAKIVFEFLYRIFHDEWLLKHPAAPVLRDLAMHGKPADQVHIGRCPRATEGFEPFHAIVIYLDQPVLMSDIILFGKIYFRVTVLEPCEWITPSVLGEITGIQDIVGMECQQDLKPVRRGLRWLTKDGTNPQIRAW